MSVQLVRKGTPGAQPLMTVAYLRTGSARESIRALQMIQQWALARMVLGHDLGEEEGGGVSAAVREYARWWKVSERTAWRELSSFQNAFPEEQTPAELAAQLIEHVEDLQARFRGAVKGRKGRADVVGQVLALVA